MNKDNLIILFPDAGAFKWGMKLLDKLNWTGDVCVASKCRQYSDGKTKLIQVIERADFGGKDVLVIDDLLVGGGTFLGLANLLKERNVGRLFLAVSHITIQTPNKALEAAYERIFTTNSKYSEYNLSNLVVYDYNDLKIFE